VAKHVNHQEPPLAPVISLTKYKEARHYMSRAGALRAATYPDWPGNEFADGVMDFYLTNSLTLSDAELCEHLEISPELLAFILDREWNWYETFEVDLDENGKPRLYALPDPPSAADPKNK